MPRANKLVLIFLVILAVTEITSVALYGSITGFEHNGTLWFRDTTRALIALTGIAGLLLLPRGDRWFPRFHWIPLTCFAYLLFWGTFMVLNAKSEHNYSVFIMERFADEDRLIPNLPGSIVKTVTAGFVLEIGAIFLFLLMIARSVESRSWRGIMISFGLCAILVAIIGLGHKILNIPTVWGIPDKEAPQTFFAPFLYAANAAAFMNLGLPVVMAIALHTQREKGVQPEFFAWILGIAVLTGGILAAASKAGAIIMLAQLLFFLILEFKTFREAWTQRKRGSGLGMEKTLVLGAVATIFLVLSALSAGYLVDRFGRFFTEIDEQGSASTITGRVAMIKKTAALAFDDEDQPWAGLGAGSFRHAINFYIRPSDTEIIEGGKSWRQAHCDPVQTVWEWGFLGALAWFIFGIGAYLRGWYLLITHKIPEGSAYLVKAILIALTGVGIHSCFDFPLSILSIHLVAVAFCGILWSLGHRHCESVEVA